MQEAVRIQLHELRVGCTTGQPFTIKDLPGLDLEPRFPRHVLKLKRAGAIKENKMLVTYNYCSIAVA